MSLLDEVETMLSSSRQTGNTTQLIDAAINDVNTVLVVGRYRQKDQILYDHRALWGRVFTVHECDKLRGIAGKKLVFDHTAIYEILFHGRIEMQKEYRRGKAEVTAKVQDLLNTL
jgi:hypothetical protein